MSHDEREYETEPVPDLGPLRSDRSRRTTILVCIVMAVIGSGVAFLWRGYGAFEGLPIFKTETAPQAVSSKAFEEYQQATAVNLGRDREMLQALDAEIKRLSDQVLRLTIKMDSLESSARRAGRYWACSEGGPEEAGG